VRGLAALVIKSPKAGGPLGTASIELVDLVVFVIVQIHIDVDLQSIVEKSILTSYSYASIVSGDRSYWANAAKTTALFYSRSTR